MAWGAHQQFIVVIPDADIVAVLTASVPVGFDYFTPADLVDYILGCVRADTDLPDPKDQLRLDSALQSAATERPDAVDEPSPLAKEVSGKSYEFDDNALRLKTLALNLVGPNPTWSVSRETSATDKTIKTQSGPLGLNGVYPEGPSQVGVPIAKGRWVSATSFEVQVRVLGRGETYRWVFEFRGPAVDLHFEDNAGVTAEAHGTTRQ